MNVRIGITNNSQPIVVNLDASTDREELEKRVHDALNGIASTLRLTDVNGRCLVVSSAHIAYLEFDPQDTSPIGFG